MSLFSVKPYRKLATAGFLLYILSNVCNIGTPLTSRSSRLPRQSKFNSYFRVVIAFRGPKIIRRRLGGV